MTHTHECRRCGSSIDCDGDEDDAGCWEGDNVGCPNELAEYAAEAQDGGTPVRTPFVFSAETQAILDRIERQRQETAQEQRDEFIAEGRAIPDLEFTTPDCPICGLPTDYEEGYECKGCQIAWPRNGYGHRAEQWG